MQLRARSNFSHSPWRSQWFQYVGQRAQPLGLGNLTAKLYQRHKRCCCFSSCRYVLQDHDSRTVRQPPVKTGDAGQQAIMSQPVPGATLALQWPLVSTLVFSYTRNRTALKTSGPKARLVSMAVHVCCSSRWDALKSFKIPAHVVLDRQKPPAS